MKVDAPLVGLDLRDVPARAAAVEAMGYDGVYTFEGPHDPFLPLALAAEHTERVELATAIAIAFARSPTHLAHLGWDLQELSRGRAILGLGSQIKAHIEQRFSMPWSRPAARMRELVLAIRAIWTSWQDGTPLRFEGEMYRHTLMTPFFSPGPNPFGAPRIFLAGVGPAMTEVAGEVADGFLVHPFSTPAFLTDVTIPALQRGLERAGRPADALELAWPVMVACGADDAAVEAATTIVRGQIAFYGSTPAYRVVLDHHGLGDLQPELRRLTKEGRWAEMAALVDDDVLDLFALRGTPTEVGRGIRERAGGLVQRVSLNAPYAADPTTWGGVLAALQA